MDTQHLVCHGLTKLGSRRNLAIITIQKHGFLRHPDYGVHRYHYFTLELQAAVGAIYGIIQNEKVLHLWFTNAMRFAFRCCGWFIVSR